MKNIRIGDVQNSLVRLLLWEAGRVQFSTNYETAAKNYFLHRCAYCGEARDLQFDHAVPINREALGQHRPGNLIPSCYRCNQDKGKRDFREYLRHRPDGSGKLNNIEDFMRRHGYSPLGASVAIKELLDEARRELVDLAERYRAKLHSQFLSEPIDAAKPASMPSNPSHSLLGADRSEIRIQIEPQRDRSAVMNGATDRDRHLEQIKEIRTRMNRSWVNLRRACYELMGRPAAHGTANVGASSRAFAKAVQIETRLSPVQIVALLDRHSLGLEP